MINTYLQYAQNILSQTHGDKSTNTLRILFALNSFPNGATYTQLLKYSLSFNQSALSRTLQNCLNRNQIDYNTTLKTYKSNLYFDINTLEANKLIWLKKLLASTLVGANITLIRIVIFLSSINEVYLSDLAKEIQLPEQQTENAITSLTDDLGTQIIIYDKISKKVSANLNWFK